MGQGAHNEVSETHWPCTAIPPDVAFDVDYHYSTAIPAPLHWSCKGFSDLCLLSGFPLQPEKLKKTETARFGTPYAMCSSSSSTRPVSESLLESLVAPATQQSPAV